MTRGQAPKRRTADASVQAALDVAAQKIDKASRKTDRAIEKVARHAELLDRLADHLEALDVWTRAEPGTRRPRFTREEIAATAVRLADTEGLDALSMRRLAAELDAGTMTLYHYVRTKDELLALVVDTVMGEIVLPPGERLPEAWAEAVAVVARRSRDALQRHPWILDISDDPAVGPNSVRHFDQSMQAVTSLDADLGTKCELIMAVDEYVFGYCLHQRTTFSEGGDDISREMLLYVEDLLGSGDYPELARLVEHDGVEALWTQIHGHAHDPDRFERNLARLLDGFARQLEH